ncbi:hypothetical protein [Streptomyces sp. MS1.AVA.4]|uniref:Uncharacterized protein n=1 Tax=Streptomyces pratisoli TaxID=3139917 RepID=A0ACC6QBE6_9ACTN
MRGRYEVFVIDQGRRRFLTRRLPAPPAALPARPRPRPQHRAGSPAQRSPARPGLDLAESPAQPDPVRS